jgi:hypothetical protein
MWTNSRKLVHVAKRQAVLVAVALCSTGRQLRKLLVERDPITDPRQRVVA